MGAADLNYFTCTLGQAALLKKEGRQQKDSFQTVIQLIEEQAESLPDSPALGFANLRKGECRNQSLPDQVTFSELCRLSISAAVLLKASLPSAADGQYSETVGLICSSSLDFVLTWLGLMQLGRKAFLLAPQLDSRSIDHLCTGSDVRSILVDKVHEQRTSQFRDSINIVKIPQYEGDSQSKTDIPEGKGLSGKSSDIAYLRHTSGTSSGLPKPILQTQWGAVGCLPVLPDQGQAATFSTTPLYHGGLADCFRAWTSGAAIWFFAEGLMPITGANVLKAVAHVREESQASSVKYFSSVPYVLQMLAEEDEGIKLLQTMDMVGVGGAALPPSVGDRLVKLDVNLVSRMGSAECGFLMSSHRNYSEDTEWQYLRPMDDPSFLSFEPRDDGLSELVVKPAWPLRTKVNRDDGSYATADLFEPHPSMPNAWRYDSRADAQITLANGKKFDPSLLEGAIRASTDMLQDVLIFGAGRDYAGALLFKASPDVSTNDVLDAVWPEVQQLNTRTQSHARLTKAMLVIIDAEGHDAPLPKSSKGTILRHQAEDRYADVIDSAYTGRGSNMGQARHMSGDDIFSVVSSLFSEVLGREIDAEQDLYEQGVDSIACIQIRKLVEISVLPPGSAPLPMNVIYDNGTIRSLANTLVEVRRGTSDLNNPADHREGKLMRELADKYCQFPPMQVDVMKKEGIVVVLTGATGVLGVHVLSQMSNDPKVRKVYCLLRASTPFAARERVAKALLNKKLIGLQEVTEAHALDDRITCLPCDLTGPQLGLSDESWRCLVSEATVFIHSAWSVNFSLRLTSFENQLAGTLNMINAALASDSKFFFVSSTAAVSNTSSGDIAEKPSLDPKDASPLGYSRSKWVAERVCSAAHEHLLHDRTSIADSRGISIIRVGQLCGNQAGAWNASEAYPLMLSTASFAGCLPALPSECLNWLPVDTAAKAVLDIALPSPATQNRGSSTSESQPPIPVYHVLNPHRTPSWRKMLDWIAKAPGGSSFDIVPAAEWLDRLERALKASETKHPSQALLGLWKRKYSLAETISQSDEVEKSAGNGPPKFQVLFTQRTSETMRDVEPLEEGDVIRMWEWIQGNS